MNLAANFRSDRRLIGCDGIAHEPPTVPTDRQRVLTCGLAMAGEALKLPSAMPSPEGPKAAGGQPGEAA